MEAQLESAQSSSIHMEERLLRDLALDNGHVLRSMFNALVTDEEQECLGASIAAMMLRLVARHKHDSASSALVGQLLALCWDYEMNRAAEVNRNAHLFMRGNGVVPKIWRHVLSPSDGGRKTSNGEDPFSQLRLYVNEFLDRSLRKESPPPAESMTAEAGREAPPCASSLVVGPGRGLLLVTGIDAFLDGSADEAQQAAGAESVAAWMDGLMDVLWLHMQSWPLFFRYSLHFLARERPQADVVRSDRAGARSPPPAGRRNYSNMSNDAGSDCPASPSTGSTFTASFALEGTAQPHHVVVLPIIMLRFVTPQVVMFAAQQVPAEGRAKEGAGAEQEEDLDEMFSRTRRRLTFLGKVLQKVANGQRFDGPHEDHLRAINAFVTRSHDHMLEFAQELANPPMPAVNDLNIFSFRRCRSASADDPYLLHSLRKVWLREHEDGSWSPREECHDLVAVAEIVDNHFCAIVREMNSRLPLLASANQHLLLRASRYAERRLLGVGRLIADVGARDDGVQSASASSSRPSSTAAIMTNLLNAVRRKSFTTAKAADATSTARSMIAYACKRIVGLGDDLGYSNHFVSVIGVATTGEPIVSVHGDLLARSWELFAVKGAANVAAVKRSLPEFTGSTQEADIQSYLLFWLEIAVRCSAADGSSFQVVYHCPHDGDGKCPLGPNWLHNWICSVPEEWSSRCSQVIVVKQKEGGLLQSLLLKTSPGGAAGGKRIPCVGVADSCAQLGQLCQIQPPGPVATVVVPCSIIAASQGRSKAVPTKLWPLQTMRDVTTFVLRVCDGEGCENVFALTEAELAHVRSAVLYSFWCPSSHVAPAVSRPKLARVDSAPSLATSPSPDRSDAPPGTPDEQKQSSSPPRQVPSPQTEPRSQPPSRPAPALVSVSNMLHYPTDVAKADGERRTFEAVVNEVVRDSGKATMNRVTEPPVAPTATVATVPVVSLAHCPVQSVVSLLVANISKSFSACLGDGTTQRGARSWSLLHKLFYNLTFAPPLQMGEQPHSRVHTALANVLADTGTLTIGQKLEVGLLGIVASLCMLVRQLDEWQKRAASMPMPSGVVIESVEHRIRDLMFCTGVPPGTQRAAVDEVCTAMATCPEAFLSYANFFAGATLAAPTSQPPKNEPPAVNN